MSSVLGRNENNGEGTEILWDCAQLQAGINACHTLGYLEAPDGSWRAQQSTL